MKILKIEQMNNRLKFIKKFIKNLTLNKKMKKFI